MLKLLHPITSINGFKIGDKVRLQDGDGRPHIIKSFFIDGMKEFFFEVQFEDGTETMLDNIAPLPSNLDEAAGEYSERFQDGKDKLYAFHGFRDGALWRDSQIQRLSNGIDGAAELSANDAMIKRQFPSVVYNTGLKCFDHSDLIKQFKAGAEWMAGQGWICKSSRPIFIKGYEQAEKDTIEMACHWLFAHLPILIDYYNEDIHKKSDRSEFIKLFRTQMEGK